MSTQAEFYNISKGVFSCSKQSQLRSKDLSSHHESHHAYARKEGRSCCNRLLSKECSIDVLATDGKQLRTTDAQRHGVLALASTLHQHRSPQERKLIKAYEIQEGGEPVLDKTGCRNAEATAAPEIRDSLSLFQERNEGEVDPTPPHRFPPSQMASQLLPSFLPEIGPDGIARENPVIAYTEKLIEEEHIQLKRYIQENYSKIRDVERELENLTLELKLTAGPKKAALEHLRKKIELQSERIHVAKLKEDQAKKVWKAASQAVRDEEETKKKLCDDLNQLVQESTTTQLTRLEELKRRLAALNPSRCSFVVYDGKSVQQTDVNVTASQPAQLQPAESSGNVPENTLTRGNNNGHSASDGRNQLPVEVKEKKRIPNLGRGKGSMILPKVRGPSDPGWTGAGFDVDNGT